MRRVAEKNSISSSFQIVFWFEMRVYIVLVSDKINRHLYSATYFYSHLAKCSAQMVHKNLPIFRKSCVLYFSISFVCTIWAEHVAQVRTYQKPAAGNYPHLFIHPNFAWILCSYARPFCTFITHTSTLWVSVSYLLQASGAHHQVGYLYRNATLNTIL